MEFVGEWKLAVTSQSTIYETPVVKFIPEIAQKKRFIIYRERYPVFI